MRSRVQVPLQLTSLPRGNTLPHRDLPHQEVTPPSRPPPPGMYPAQPGYPQQPPGYGQPGAPPTTVVVTQPTMVVTQQRFRESPVSMTCPHCSAQITTSTEYTVGTMAWMVAGGVCLAGLAFPVVWLGCCFIPLCIPSLKDVIHTCPNCSREVGRFDRTRS